MNACTKPLPELAARRAVRELASRFPCSIEQHAPGLSRIRAEGCNAEFAEAVAESFARGTFTRDRADFEL